MLNILCKIPTITLTVIVVSFTLFTEAKAFEQPANQDFSSNVIRANQRNAEKDSLRIIENYNDEHSMDQVTNVNQLRDVSSTDWAYEALRSLVDRYGCIVGYPNQTYRGNQALSRYEFAAGLNACLNQIERLLADSQTMSQEELNTILRLMQEFQEELAILKGRTDGIQARIGELELTQFSTTTKLAGEVIFGLGSVLAGEADQVAVLGNRTRLELETSFTGKDLLFTRLSTGNFPSFAEETGTFAGDLAFAEPADNDLGLEVLFYNFPLGDKTNIILGPAGIAADDIANTVSVLDGDAASGAISAFGTRNPIYLPPGDAGLGIIHRLADTLELSAGYLASPANEATQGNGLLNGPFSALGQITFTPSESLTIAATYVHGYNQSDTETGSNLANIQSLTEDLFGQAVPTVSNSYSLQFSYSISTRLIVGGWGTLSKVTTLDSLAEQLNRGTQDVWNWAATLALPDLGKEGNLAGIIVGMEPWVTDSSIEGIGDDADTSLHVEAFYQYMLTDHIAITPGVVWVSAPDNNQDNDDLVIGTIRTTFSF
ncbi:cyanobacterial porin [Stanieria cyanosphaera PCC 7437]|uniref:Cyanobacterial porin n=1 Tax=Stanieria cyanosphaera (strain ATCC 29371 / PCC 7437) TaxID=111780 RepID=K9XTP9_STAC7|nr:iron uptake porin [Stanieria cyanosphaera]AFZ35451.1 cyanobacterial porin [Stanieria cyanosphaera PCC 7437]